MGLNFSKIRKKKGFKLYERNIDVLLQLYKQVMLIASCDISYKLVLENWYKNCLQLSD